MLPLLLACAAPSVPLGDAPPTADPPVDALRVAADGSEEFTSINEAIAAATAGDTILVEPGTYRERIDFRGRTVRVESTDGPEVTILDAQGNGANVTATNGEGSGTVISGFTLDNGETTYGAAVNVLLASLRIEDSVIRDATGSAIVYAASGDLELANVTFESLHPTRGGMIVYSDRAAVVMDGVDFACGSASYGAYLSHGSGFIDESRIDCRGKQATVWTHSTGNLFRSWVYGSTSIEAEDDHYTDTVRFENDYVEGSISALYGTLIVRNSIVSGGSVSLTTTYTDTTLENSIFLHSACAFTSDTTKFHFQYNAIHDTPATSCTGDDRLGVDGNVSADPMFTDEEGGDYTLAPRSPLVDAGTTDEAQADVDGSRNDMGIYGGPRSIGGGW